MTYDEEQELLRLVYDNNRMLREIIAYTNLKESQADNENNNDFFRNIIANLISSGLTLDKLNTNNYGNINRNNN